MRRKSGMIVAVLLSAGLLLSGCTTGGGGGASGSGAAAQKTVVYWSMFNKGEPLQLVLEQMISQFESENPDIKIEANWAGRDVLTKIQAAVSGGTPVDIVDQSNDRLQAALVDNNLAVDLTSYLAQPAYGKTAGAWKDDFTPGSLEAFASGGKVYMIPRESYISGIWYNAGILAAAGIKPTATGMTWDTFVQMLATLKSKNPDIAPLGADASVDFYNNWWFSYLAIRTAGLKAFQDAANDATGNGWRAPEFLKAAQMVRQLQDAGYFQPDFQASVYPAMQALFAQGQVAMFLNGAWIPKEVGPQLSSDFKLDVFAFPNVTGGKGNDLVEYWSNAFAVLNTGKQTDAAVTFLKFVMSKDKGGPMLSNAGFPIPLVGAATPPEYAGQVEILSKYQTIAQRGGLQGMASYAADVYNACDDPFFLMQTTPDAFIDCLATSTAKYWASHPK